MNYTPQHDWLCIENGIATIGISAYAKKELGEIVYLELPKIGKKVVKGDDICILESTKSAADLFSPLSGTIIQINDSLKQHLDLLNTDPEGEGWLYKLEGIVLEEIKNLLTKEEYISLLGISI